MMEALVLCRDLEISSKRPFYSKNEELILIIFS